MPAYQLKTVFNPITGDLDFIALPTSTGGPAFGIIQTPNGTFPTASVPTDTLTLTSTDNSITITGNATTDTVNIALGPYTGSALTTITVGGLTAGTNVSGQTLNQILNSILSPYISPTFSAFAITQTNPVEVGVTLSGSKSFTFTYTTPANITPNTTAIIDVTGGGTVLASGLPNTSPQSANIGSVQLVAPGSYSWQGRATNTNSVLFYSSNSTINWYWRLYYGTSANVTLNATQIQALASSTLTNTKNATYNLVANDYKYFAWADSLGSPTAVTGFKDNSTGLAVAMADSTDNLAYSNVQNGWSYALVSVTNTYSVTTNYRVYRTKNTLGGSIQIVVS